MKKIVLITVAFLFIAFFTGCKKNDYPSPFKENCKLLSLTGSDGSKTTYTYDVNGLIDSETFSVSGYTWECKYTRKRNGQLESSQKFLNGEIRDNCRYTSSNGRVVKVEHLDKELTKVMSIRYISYNSKGLLSEQRDEYPDFPESGSKVLFEYDEVGQFTKRTIEDLNGNIAESDIFKNTGSPSRASEVFLMQHGLSFPEFDNMGQGAFALAYPGVGSEVEIYVPIDGKMLLVLTQTLVSKELNMGGYTQSLSYKFSPEPEGV